MSFTIKRSTRVGESVRAIAASQTAAAIDEIRDRERPVEWRIHQLRKRCKKVRALIRLVEGGFPGAEAAQIAYRDIARLVAGHRDARVMANTVRALAGSDGKPKKNPVVRWFRDRADVAEQVAQPVLGRAEQLLAGAAVEIERWDLRGLEVDDVMEGFGRALAIVDERAPGSVCDETNHAWRKAVKDHWYQLRLLKRVTPKGDRKRVKAFDDLGELLGDAHDLSVLILELEELPGYLRNDVTAKRIAVLAYRKRRELRAQALELGDTLNERNARDFAHAIARKWHRYADTPAEPEAEAEASAA